MGLGALARLAHRGAVDADGRTGDGAGVTTQIPFDVLRPDLNALGLAALGPGQLAVGLVFLPRAEPAAAQAQQVVALGLAANGLTLAGWRGVPVHEDALGDTARACRPQIAHVIVPRPEGVAADEFERRLYRARRAIDARAAAAGLSDLYVASLSHRTLVYKALVRAVDLADFYADLRQPEFATAFVTFHQRFSTNTLPSWSHDPALPHARAQRRDQHHRRQPELDAGARAAPGRAAAGSGAGSAGADPRRGDERLRLASTRRWRCSRCPGAASPTG